jgi:pimeloyl-ACP methyl ester carboxylesterase
MNDCISRYDVRDRLDEIEIPVFVYVGRHDWIAPVKVNEEVARGIPGSTFVVYEKAGHFAAIEEKTKFGQDVRAWLKKIDIAGL